MRRTLKIVSFFMLLLALSTCSAFPALAEVGPGVSQSTEAGVNNNAENGIGSSGVGISTLPAVGQTTWGYSETPSVNISYIVSKDTCTFQYVVTRYDIEIALNVMHSEDTRCALLRRPQSSLRDSEYMLPFTLPNGVQHEYWITRDNLKSADAGLERHFANVPNKYKYYDKYACGVRILDTIEYHEDDPMLETHYRVTAILDPLEVMWLMSFMYDEGVKEMYLAEPFTLPDGRQVMVRVTEQQVIDISHNTPTETVYLPITEYFPINP